MEDETVGGVERFLSLADVRYYRVDVYAGSLGFGKSVGHSRRGEGRGGSRKVSGTSEPWGWEPVTRVMGGATSVDLGQGPRRSKRFHWQRRRLSKGLPEHVGGWSRRRGQWGDAGGPDPRRRDVPPPGRAASSSLFKTRG